MSYDLYFKKRRKEEQLALDAFNEYFGSRKNYKVEKGQAIYGNESTGVYFIFEHITPENSEEYFDAVACLNLNYNRPHVFGLEAEPEVFEFVKKFDFVVEDPQINGMGAGEYDRKLFIEGYNYGNEVFGPKSFFDTEEKRAAQLTLPRSVIEKCWRWNYEKDALQEKVGENVFVPTIMFSVVEGRVIPVVVWSDVIPSLLPMVDTVIYRSQFAPKKGFFKGREADFVSLKADELLPLLSEYPQEEHAFSCKLVIPNQSQHKKLVEWVTALTPTSKPAMVSMDGVLDKEALDNSK